MPIDWDNAFANMVHIPGADAMPGQWAKEAETYRGSGIRVEEIPYGTAPREKLDIVWPEDKPVGLAVFVHGGFWLRMTKDHWTHLAHGARAKGWAVAIPGYTLAPEVRISQITVQIAAAITKAAGLIEGPIRLAGHSAGGHLVSRMICADTPLIDNVSGRIEHTLSISGLHDLRPLMKTKMNTDLHLDLAEARRESSALQEPLGTPRVTAWVGGGELPEFIRQSRLLVELWAGLDADVQLKIDSKHNHFNVLDGLQDPDSPITEAFVEKCK